MNLETCTKLVQEIALTAKPISHESDRALNVSEQTFRIRPDERFVFPYGHLLIEYERMKRPVESISKYWWLLLKTDWLECGERIAVVVLMLDPRVNKIRTESVELLGQKLQERFPKRFSFFFVPPNSLSTSSIRQVVGEAMARVESEAPWP